MSFSDSSSPSPVSSRSMSPLTKLEDHIVVPVPLSRYLDNGLSISLDYSPTSPWAATDHSSIVQSHRRVSSNSSSVTSPSPVSPVFDSSEDSEYSWNLIPYNIPWGPSYYAYEAGTLPGPEGTCVFLRSPTPVKNQRTSQACIKCRERKAKCSGTHPTCDRCLARDHVCQYVSNNKRAKGPISDPKKRKKAGGSHQKIAPAQPASTEFEVNAKDAQESLSSELTDSQSEPAPQLYSPSPSDFSPEGSLDGVSTYPDRDFAHIRDWYSIHGAADLQWQSVHTPQPLRYSQAADLLSPVSPEEAVPQAHSNSSMSPSCQMEFPAAYPASFLDNGAFNNENIQTHTSACLPSDSMQSSGYQVYAHGDPTYRFDQISRPAFDGDTNQIYSSIGGEHHMYQPTTAGVFTGNYPYPYPNGVTVNGLMENYADS